MGGPAPEESRRPWSERLPSDFHPGARCRRGNIRLGLGFKGVGVLGTGRALFVCGALLRSCRLHRGDLLPDRRRLLLFFLFTSNQGHHHRTRQERPSGPFFKFYLHKNTYGSTGRFAFDKSIFFDFPFGERLTNFHFERISRGSPATFFHHMHPFFHPARPAIPCLRTDSLCLSL